MYSYALVLDKNYDKHWFIESQEPINKEDVINTDKGVYIVDSKGIHFGADNPSVLWIISAIPAEEYIAELKQKADQQQ